jgi:GH25 family lysozyme M1 (1,4-beta-N-acetylmuramidase)/LysM repeat protein
MYSRPVDLDIPTTQAFGAGAHLSWQLGFGHLGIDFGCAVGTTIRAIGAGTVLWANWGHAGLQDRSWEARWYLVPENAGICVVIDHGSHISIYAHLNRTDLNIGDWVNAGDKVGESGSTGLSTGPHLHLELVAKPFNYKNGKYGRVDPMPFLTGVAPSAPVQPAASGTSMRGIDISNYQKGINVAATGAQFAIVKASEGVGWGDPSLAANIASARSAGVPAGFYHFGRFGATRENTPTAEAESFLAIIAPHLRDGDVVVLDVESDDQSPASAKVFLDIVSSRTGRKALAYMNLSTARSAGWDVVARDYPLWLAQYPSRAAQSWGPLAAQPDPGNGWSVALWQYTDQGALAGWNGTLDLNVFNGGVAEWNALAAGSGFVPSSAPAGPSAPSMRVPSNLIIVEAGDTLSGIAVQWNVDFNALVTANPGINPNVIHPGDVLRLPGGSVAASRPAAAVSQCVVEAGDTLSGIAVQFGVDLNALISLNGIANPNSIHPGQVLNLPVASAAAPVAVSQSAGVTQCVVESGDTLSGIAAQFGVSLSQLIAANPGINPDLIHPGQVLNLR